jgi:hypothetical protein
MSYTTEPTIQAEPAKPEMSLIEKVKLMSDLANACQNEKIVTEIKNLPSGERIYSIFVEAVDRELQAIMNGKKEDVPKELVNTVNMTRQIQATLNSFQSLISGFMGTPLVQVLSMMNQNLGGKGFQAPPSQLQSQPQLQAHNQPQYEIMSSGDEPRSRRSSVTGLGSI